jgi:hypothetical protein
MHKEKVGNHMENCLCVGVFIVLMIIQNLILRIHKSCVVSFVIKNLNRNKFENSSKEMINFLIIKQMEYIYFKNMWMWSTLLLQKCLKKK